VLRSLAAASVVLLLAAVGFAAAGATPDNEPPTTARDEFNAGTRKLRDGKLREAEALLQNALASQIENLQPPALYNLGHVRFMQGVEELKKGPSARSAAGQGRSAAQTGAQAIQSADAALAGNDIQKMVDAYVQGHGALKEMKAARAAVRRAIQTYEATLSRWQRAEGDFKSTVEMNRADADARQNVEVVDRCIAKLVDALKDLQAMAGAGGKQRQDLGQKLKELRGRIPAPNMPPGGAGEEDEEDEDQPNGPQPGQQEGPSKEGQEMSLSPEQAGWLLDSFKLDSERRLPMGQGEEAKPRDRQRPTW
jgi:hypothetical protein